MINHQRATTQVDFRLSRNLLKGQIGDEINVLMAACAWNLRKWMVAVAIFLFWKKSGLIFCKIPEVFLLLGKKAILLILVVTKSAQWKAPGSLVLRAPKPFTDLPVE
jgi:hypothetical protein